MFQVKEAIDITRSQLVKVSDIVRHTYDDQVIVVSATVDQLQELSRPSRSILQEVDITEVSVISH